MHREQIFEDRLSLFVGENDPMARKKNVSPSALAKYKWVSAGAASGLFDLTRETLDWLGLPGVTPVMDCDGDVTIVFRILERTKACSMMPFRLAGEFASRYHVAAVDLDVKLPQRNIGLWSTEQGHDRPDCVDFVNRLNK